MRTKSYEGYYLLDGEVLARVEDEENGIASVFHERDGRWHPAHHIARKVTGIGGDANFDKISEKEVRLRFPKAF
jgi:hypothetical protein